MESVPPVAQATSLLSPSSVSVVVEVSVLVSDEESLVLLPESASLLLSAVELVVSSLSDAQPIKVPAGSSAR